MKAILEFNLPEEKDEFELASKAADYMLALYDISNEFRKLTKYQDETKSEEYHKAIEELRQKFYEILSDNNVEI